MKGNHRLPNKQIASNNINGKPQLFALEENFDIAEVIHTIEVQSGLNTNKYTNTSSNITYINVLPTPSRSCYPQPRPKNYQPNQP